MFLRYLLFCCLIARGVEARDGFVKDQNVNLVEFPPKVMPAIDQSIPVGHLRPLGWQRAAEGAVEERTETIDASTFYNEYVAKGRAVVLRELLKNLPAMQQWPQKNYLKNKYGHIQVEVVVKKEYQRKGATSMKLSKFLNDYLYEDLYLTNFLPHEMTSELILPEVLRCGLEEWLMEGELWMSSGGTSSLLHSHSDHDLHCLLSGRKDFVFIDPKFKGLFHYEEKEWLQGAGHSPLNMDQINMFQHPEMADVPWRWAIIRPGDCIFVPAGLLHQVRSYGVSISYTNHFSPSPEIQLGQCDGQQEQESLDKFNYFWTYQEGKLWLSDDNLDERSVSKHFLKLLRNQTHLTKAYFESFYNTLMQHSTNPPDMNHAWSLISTEDEISREDLKHLSSADLSSLKDILNLPTIQRRNARKEEL